MAWKTPQIIEVQVGMEINMHAGAVRNSFANACQAQEQVLACSWARVRP